MKKHHPQIRFLVEAEKNSALPFLDIKIYRENGKFVTSMYRKEAFVGVLTNFTKFLQRLFLSSSRFFTFNLKKLRKFIQNRQEI